MEIIFESLVYEKKLEKHLKVCFAGKPKVHEPYFVEGLNDGSDDEDTIETKIVPQNLEGIQDEPLIESENRSFIPLGPLKLKDRSGQPTIISKYSREHLLKVLKRVDEILLLYPLDILSQLDLNNLECPEVTVNESHGMKKRKHAIQHASLIEHLKYLNLFKSENLFLEFGSGRGTLSHIIHSILKSNHILIDRAKLRHKAERHGTEADKIFKRIVIDIKDLSLQNIDLLNQFDHIVSFSKHLCGCATDLTFRSIRATSSSPLHNNLDSIVIALCCHHKCTWKTYVGKPWLRDHNITKDDFNVIKHMSSWALSGEEGYASNLGDEFTADMKREWGKRCKRFIDIGRIKYLESCGYKVHLMYYVKDDITPENILMIAQK